MSAKDVLEDLHQRDVRLTVEGLTLLVDAPKSVATDELQRTLRENRRSLIRVIESERVRLEAAARRGLVICYARERGYITIHEPATGEWHEIPVSGCPEWVVQDAKAYRRKSA